MFVTRPIHPCVFRERSCCVLLLILPLAVLGEASDLIPAESLEQLELCDCHLAEQNSVSCSGTGFFVAGFRNAGYSEGHKGEMLPLSPALCCRPCLPKMQGLNEGTKDKAVAVITRNCVPAQGTKNSVCPAESNSFVQGFSQSEFMPSAGATLPHGPAQCCSAAVLLASGMVSPLKRCNCHLPPMSTQMITCAADANPLLAQKDGRVLWGFDRTMSINKRAPAPASPVKCCRLCYDHAAAPEPAHECEELGFCNGNGLCLEKQCLCTEGWTGRDCLTPTKESKKHMMSAWAIALTVLGSCLLTCCCKCWLISRSVRRRVAARAAAAESVREALLRRRGDSSAEEWSSDEDSHDESSDDQEPEVVVAQPSNSGSGAQEADHLEVNDENVDANLPSTSSTDVRAQQDQSEEPEANMSATGESDDPDATARRTMAECGVEPFQQSAAGVHTECLVCMSESISIVCVPCGHAAMCRACSRRLRYCPLCRSPVTRRQKLFINLSR